MLRLVALVALARLDPAQASAAARTGTLASDAVVRAVAREVPRSRGLCRPRGLRRPAAAAVPVVP